MSVARFIADQRAKYRVPHMVTCVLLGVSVSWFYKWIRRAADPDEPHTDTERRRAELDVAVAEAFDKAPGPAWFAAAGHRLASAGLAGLGENGGRLDAPPGFGGAPHQTPQWADQAGQGCPKFADLVKRDFTAAEPNRKWVGDMTEIQTESGQKLYLATVIDLYSRRLLGAAMGLHPDAELACAAINMAVAARGGRQAIWRDEEAERVIFHTDRGSTYTAHAFTKLCAAVGDSAVDGPGRVRVSTMLPRRRSSPPWSGKYCPAIDSVILSMRRLWLSTGATPSTITNAGTAPPTGSRPSTTRSGKPRPSRKRHSKSSTISGEAQTPDAGSGRRSGGAARPVFRMVGGHGFA